MKKVLLFAAVAGLFTFAACNQKPKTTEPAQVEETIVEETIVEETIVEETEAPVEGETTEEVAPVE